MEKKFKEKLTSLEQIRDECQRLNAKINEVNKNLEDNVLESNVLVNYAKEFDENYRQKLNEDNDREKDLDESEEISGS
jgi:signal recognition particle GTPase